MTTNNNPPSSSLLEIPSLDHDKKATGGEYSSASSSSASPTAATPQDLEGMGDEVSYPKSSPSDSAKRPRSMSGFDTPITSNHKIKTLKQPAIAIFHHKFTANVQNQIKTLQLYMRFREFFFSFLHFDQSIHYTWTCTNHPAM